MAYGVKYTTRAADLSGWRYRVSIEQQNWSGGVADIAPAEGFFDEQVGQQGSKGPGEEQPIQVSSVRFAVDASPGLLTELFDAPDREYRVTVERQRFEDGAALGSYANYWRGFLVTDFYEDEPFEDTSRIQLEAIDGLAFLQNLPYQPPNEEESFQPEVTRILQGIDPLAGVNIQQEWEPRGGDYDVPEPVWSNLTTQRANWRKSEDENAWRSQWDFLAEALTAFGLTLKQSGFAWEIQQRSTNAQDASSDSLNADTRNANGFKSERGTLRTFLQRATQAKSTFRFGDIYDSLISNPGFENAPSADDWTLFNHDYSVTRRKAERIGYDDDSIAEALPDPVQGNEHLLEVTYLRVQEDAFADDANLKVAEQQLPIRVAGGANKTLEFSFMGGDETFSNLLRPAVQVKIGGLYLQKTKAYVTKSALKAEDGDLLIDPVFPSKDAALVPAGATLPIFRETTKDGDFPEGEQVGTIALTEPARCGSTILRGRISEDIESPDGITYVPLFTWSTQQQQPLIHELFGGDFSGDNTTSTWKHITIPTYLQTPAGIPVKADQARIQLRAFFSRTTTKTFQLYFYADDFRFDLKADGEPVTQVTDIAFIANGYALENTVTIGDGPTAKADSRISVLYEDSNGVFRRGDLTSGWGVGSETTTLSLSELRAREALRQRRKQVETRTVTFQLRGGQDLLPHEVVSWDGALWDIGYYRRQAGGRAVGRVTVELRKLEDFGVSGISYQYAQSSEPTTPGTVNVVAGGLNESGTGGGGTLDWDNVVGKPELVNTLNGRQGHTEVLASDVTGALGYDPVDPAVLQSNYYDESEADARFLTASEVAGTAGEVVTAPDGAGGVTLGLDADVRAQSSLGLAGGHYLEDTGNALGVRAPDGTNTGVWQVDHAIVNTLEVVGSIDQQNVNNLAVKDQYVRLNDGVTGTPSLNAGLSVNQGDATDEFLLLDQGLKRWGAKTGGGGTFKRFLQDGDDATFSRVTSNNELRSMEGSFGAAFYHDDASNEVRIAGIENGTHDLFSAVRGGGPITLHYPTTVSGAVTLGAQASNTGHAVRADRSLAAGANVKTLGNLTEDRTVAVVETPAFSGVTHDGGADTSIRTDHYAEGWSGSGYAFDYDGAAEVRELSVRETLLARELEVRKITFSKGPHAFGVGAGKVSSAGNTNNDGVWTIRFEVEHGCTTDDFLLAQDYNPGSGAVITQSRLDVQSIVDPHTLTASVVAGQDPSRGTDYFVAASADSDRDSFLFVNPFIPALDVLDGLNSFSDWDSRTPKLRLGKIGGMPDVGGQTPSGYGLWGDNVYLKNGVFEGTITVTGGSGISAFSDAGALAEKSSVDLSTSEVTNKTAANITETASRKWAGEAGADITADHTGAFQLIDQINNETLIGSGVVITDHLAADAVTADEIAANVITAGHIAADTITADEIDASTITTAELAFSPLEEGEPQAVFSTINGATSGLQIEADHLHLGTAASPILAHVFGNLSAQNPQAVAEDFQKRSAFPTGAFSRNGTHTSNLPDRGLLFGNYAASNWNAAVTSLLTLYAGQQATLTVDVTVEGSTEMMVGLKPDGSGPSWPNLTYGIYLTGTTLQVAESGSSNVATLGSISVGDELRLQITPHASGASYAVYVNGAAAPTYRYESTQASSALLEAAILAKTDDKNFSVQRLAWGREAAGGTIAAERVVSGALESTNWGAQQGTRLGLDDATITARWDEADVFHVDARAQEAALAGIDFDGVGLWTDASGSYAGMQQAGAGPAFFAGATGTNAKRGANATAAIEHNGGGHFGTGFEWDADGAARLVDLNVTGTLTMGAGSLITSPGYDLMGDGSGNLANDNIRWDPSGVMRLGETTGFQVRSSVSMMHQPGTDWIPGTTLGANGVSVKETSSGAEKMRFARDGVHTGGETIETGGGDLWLGGGRVVDPTAVPKEDLGIDPVELYWEVQYNGQLYYAQLFPASDGSTGGGTPDPEGPSAYFTFSPASPAVNETVTFDASGTMAGDGSIQSYSWDFGNGQTGSGVNPTTTYQRGGEYQVTLTVTDSNGKTSTTSRTVSVEGQLGTG